ncbi:hypothetical protein A3A39_02060 [Candidatus Kaiserbacteria bacterium RIFCSPLOWO2_01_FULL_54_13]|uniref:Sortase n=1 Tax=Candidatus Kaiserbacteria bacterium RIFCSPLOWO2_01_FULL_54_13 TaxID=1798512 RepID=A0A1F6F159_9BACT|nr:MAG: hypothetical protein A3A39_02060 [Candidatus Kaiserbacteria bacterium RIFCSPLOWO2_01_FULL_54_13]
MRKVSRAPVPVFMASTIVIFFLSLSAADSVGFVPCYLDGTCNGSVALSNLPELGETPVNSEQQTANSQPTVLPERIVISEIDLDLPVQNPETRDIATLDEFLKDGPVRYVDSARLGEKGNVLIFAHTSHLPVVKNQMYKAFNRVPELEAGDSITIQGDGKSYLYTVRSVRKANVEDALIDLSPTLGQKLTLVTCDTLTSKDSRFILEADFVAML